MSTAGWVGVDLDGTLAVYDGWKGVEHIGKPIAPVVDHIKQLRAVGVEVRIFTARCQEGAVATTAIERWCAEHLGEVLPVTDRKDFSMVYALDDRVITVEANTGRFLAALPSIAAVQNHWSVADGAPDPAEFKRD